MKKTVLFIILLLLPLVSQAELSTNLSIKTVMVGNSKKLVDHKTYVDSDGNIVVPSDKGYATVQYTYQGRVIIREDFLDENGYLIDCVDGYAYKVNRYKSGILQGVEFYDAQGNPANGPDGYAKQVITYLGRQHQSTWNYDREGKPVGTHRITEYMPYLNKNLIISDSWYDTENQMAPGPNGYARVEYGYDGRIQTKVSYYAEDGSLYLYKKAGYAVMESVYEKGLKKSTHYYGKDNQLIAGPDGYAYIKYSYQKDTVTEMYYNADGTMFFNDSGICGVEKKQIAGTLTEENRYFIGEGIRGRCNDGYSGIKTVRNIRGKTVFIGYYDENDEPMIVEALGYAQMKNSYNRNLILQTTYFGTDGKPICGVEGFAIVKNTIQNKEIVKTVYYDTDGKTITNGPAGYAQAIFKNQNNNVISEQYLSADGKAYYVGDLYNEIRYTWARNKKTSESYWKDGNPTAGLNGYHEVRYEINGSGKITKKSFYDINNNLMLCDDGYAIVENEYNSDGGIMSTKYYGTDRRLILAPGTEYAFIKTILFKDLNGIMSNDNDIELENEYETEKGYDNGEIVEYHGLDGRLMNIDAGYAYIEKEFDSVGNTIRTQYYNSDGRKTACKDGYDEIRREYNDKKQAIRIEYWLNGERMLNAKGYAIVIQEYDEAGLVSGESYYGVTEEPVRSVSGYHRVEKVLEGKGRATSEAWFDENNEPIALKDVYVKIEREFDEAGNVVTERYYGAEGEKIPCKDGYDEIRREYNDKKQAIRIEYWLNGERMLNAKGYAIVKQEFDEAGLVSGESYYGVTEEPVRSVSGYHRVEKVLEGKGRATSEAWFDENNEPIALKDVYVKIEREFDEAGNVVTERYYGPDGEKTACKDGYDEVHRTADGEEIYYLNGDVYHIPKVEPEEEQAENEDAA